MCTLSTTFSSRVKFVVYNYGDLVHEFNIATKEMHIKHQPEMMMMVEKDILLGDRIDLKKIVSFIGLKETRARLKKLKKFLD